ncbi:MAG TPA: hypothetical protein PKY10_09120 [Lentisphaeria bacterium]|nr:hypothetical protein [Lentisphaeria bacterium]
MSIICSISLATSMLKDKPLAADAGAAAVGVAAAGAGGTAGATGAAGGVDMTLTGRATFNAGGGDGAPGAAATSTPAAAPAASPTTRIGFRHLGHISDGIASANSIFA